MIPAPTDRLVVLALAIAVPALALAGYFGGGNAAILLAMVGILIPLALDLFYGGKLADSLVVSLRCDGRVTQGKTLEIYASIHGGGHARFALDAPRGWEFADEVLDAGIGPGVREVVWKVIPRDRGRQRIDWVFHESISVMGLWSWRGRTSVNHEVRVYPDLSAEKSALAPLFLRKASIGLHRARMIGKGREFEQLREYMPGDGYEDIDWKATARRRMPVTKIYRLERSQDLYIVLDASRRSARRLTVLESQDPHAPLQVDRFVRAALALFMAALHQGDRPGLAVFGNSLTHFLRAGSGKTHYDACRDKLFDLKAAPYPPDFADLFAELRNRIRQRALLIFLTDLDDPVLANHFVEEVSHLSRHHLVLVGQLQSPGVSPLFDKAHEVENDSEVYNRLAGHLLWEVAQETRAKLRANGVHCVNSTAEHLVPDMISAYLDLKRRQIL